MTTSTHRCGSVAIVGRPNVGKSTLLNRLLGQKIAIVSPKPETTRQRLVGILTLEGAQALFIDTPGIYRGPKTLLAKHQIEQARAALNEADVVLLITEAPAGVTDEDRQIVQLLPKMGTGTFLPQRQPPSKKEPVPVLLAINKVDRVEKSLILLQIDEYHRLYPFKEIFPISATRGENVQELLKALVEALPPGPALYPADQVTDRPIRELARELIREKALLFTHEEIPHAVAVAIEEWRPGKAAEPSARKANRAGKATEPAREGAQSSGEATEELKQGKQRTYVRATVFVERESQKGILIGKGGAMLKRIGQAARQEIESLVGGSVFLDLWVKVAENWRKDPQVLRQLGYG